MELVTKFGLGDRVRDKINDFEGIIVGFTKYITGCDQYLVESKDKQTDGSQISRWIDELRLNLVTDGEVNIHSKVSNNTVKPKGGPQSNTPPIRNTRSS